MEAIKSWAFSLCISAVVGSVMTFLLPEGSLQKTFKTVLCVFFLCVMLSPLSDIKLPKTDEFFRKTKTNEIIFTDSEEYEKFLEDKIINSAEDALDEAGITAKDISLKINISKDGNIYINKFVLYLKEGTDAEKAAESVFKKAGIRPETVFYGDNQNG